jgi:site-specific recombinase
MNAKTPDRLLTTLDEAGSLDFAETLRLIVDWLRPTDDRGSVAPVIGRIEQLVLALDGNPDLRQRLRERLEKGLQGARHLTLYTGIGLFSRQGFLREFTQRLYERLNPRPIQREDLKDVLSYVFHRPSDANWVAALPDDAWWRLLEAIGCLSGEHPAVLTRARDEILYALEMLSLWVAAEELEPELLRLDPRIAERDSAFVAQQRELAGFVQAYRAWTEDPARDFVDDRHARVLLDQCSEQIARLRRRAVTRGSSISLTHLLERLDQTLERIRRLLHVLDPGSPEQQRRTAAALFRELVTANARRHGVRSLWQDNIGLLARSVTQQASETGEHYITSNRSEYLGMLRSGAGAGLIIAVMAWIKIQIEAMGLGQGATTLWVSLNYGLGFVLIHTLHFTVATKQPAMTAARLAAAIEESDQGTANPAKLADLLIQVGRSQFVAVVGNVGVALPVALGLGWLYHLTLGASVLDATGVEYQLNQLSPFAGLALFHAAIAGLWLFVAGLISGFFDNRCAYLDLPGRLRDHPLLRRMLSERGRLRLAGYIEHNYGALAGNFFFGVLLGITGYLGYLLSLPLDIRHVAFASANLGYAASVQLPGALEFLLYVIFVLLIGAVNLWVSFGLALYVALKARGTHIGALNRLLKAYGQRILEHPREFLLPPPDAGSDESSGSRRN